MERIQINNECQKSSLQINIIAQRFIYNSKFNILLKSQQLIRIKVQKLMNIQELLQLEKKKAQLQKKKNFLVQKALRQKKQEQINANQQSTKKGYIEKTKFIKKKQYEVVHQKTRNIQSVEIQDNASVSSYLINNSNYQKIYERTKKIIHFGDEDKLNLSVSALKAFAEEHFEKILHLKITFAKSIQCGNIIRPFQLQLPTKIPISLTKQYPIPKAIILTKSAKQLQKNSTYKSLINYPIAIKEYSEFVKEWKNDKEFKKKMSQNRILVLCDWEVFKESTKLVEGLMDKGFVVFPFDVKKVPYFVKEKYGEISYEEYLKMMLENEYSLIKSGTQHSVHLKLNKQHAAALLKDNIKQAIIQSVSKLLERNKDKSGNQVTKIQAKTNTSINFVIYEKH